MPAIAVIVISARLHVLIGAARLSWLDEKVAAIIRVPVRRGVIPIEIRETVVRAIVPIPAEADSTDGVRIDEVGVASSVPDLIQL